LTFQPERREARRGYDRKRSNDNPWRALYRTSRWRKLRARQLDDEPFCRTCVRLGVKTPANVCDHINPHRGDPILFWSGPFQSLCGPHHSRDKQSAEAGRPRPSISADGWPEGEGV
jgi:5-methylcytosine-specific restriction protein A